MNWFCTFQVLTHRKVTMEVTPMTFITAEMKPVSVGRFLISCQIYAHRHGKKKDPRPRTTCRSN